MTSQILREGSHKMWRLMGPLFGKVLDDFVGKLKCWIVVDQLHFNQKCILCEHRMKSEADLGFSEGTVNQRGGASTYYLAKVLLKTS